MESFPTVVALTRVRYACPLYFWYFSGTFDELLKIGGSCYRVVSAYFFMDCCQRNVFSRYRVPATASVAAVVRVDCGV